MRKERSFQHRRVELLLVGLAASAAFLALLAPRALAGTALVVDQGAGTVSVIDTQANRETGSPIKVGAVPLGIAITPNAKTAYVTNFGSGTVSVIDVQRREVVGSPIQVGPQPAGIAIAPDGTFAYVANEGAGSVSVIDTRTNSMVGSPIVLSSQPRAIAIAPDGALAYVTKLDSTVSAIDTRTRAEVGSPIGVGGFPFAIAITPDGRAAYVANFGEESVSAIDLKTGQAAPIHVGKSPEGIAIAPDGGTAYVANDASESVSVIDTRTNLAAPAPIPVSPAPIGIAVAPDGGTVFATSALTESVTAIDTLTKRANPSLIKVGREPFAIAIAPDQPPTASFGAPRARPGVPVALDASASSDPDGTIASYAWSFGDLQAATLGAPSATHVYRSPGTYAVSLTLTDNEGCSTARVFTGQTVSCDGSALASATMPVTVSYPGVRLRCPRRARSRGCLFKLQAIARGPRRGHRAKAASALARARLRPGRATVVSLVPKKAFSRRLAVAKTVLVKEVARVGSSQRTLYRRLKIVQ